MLPSLASLRIQTGAGKRSHRGDPKTYYMFDDAVKEEDIDSYTFGNFFYQANAGGITTRYIYAVDDPEILRKIDALRAEITATLARSHSLPQRPSGNFFFPNASEKLETLRAVAMYIQPTLGTSKLSLRFPNGVLLDPKSIDSGFELAELHLTFYAAKFGIGPEVLCAFPLLNAGHEDRSKSVGIAYVFESGATNLRDFSNHSNAQDPILDQVGNQITTLIRLASSKQLVLGDIRADNIIVRTDRQASQLPEVKFIDFDNRYTAVAYGVSNDAVDCIETVNCLLFLNSMVSTKRDSSGAIIEASAKNIQLAKPTAERLRTIWFNNQLKDPNEDHMILCNLVEEKTHQQLNDDRLSPPTVPRLAYDDDVHQLLANLVWERIKRWGNPIEFGVINNEREGKTFLEKMVRHYVSTAIESVEDPICDMLSSPSAPQFAPAAASEASESESESERSESGLCFAQPQQRS